MNKKTIIALLVLVIIGFGAYIFIKNSSENSSSQGLGINGPGGNPPQGKTLTAAEKEVCGITAEVTEGPYYVSGTRQLVDGNLNYTNLSGSPLKVSGYVYEGLTNNKPLANTKIEFWQTDMDGSYHPNANGDISKYSDSEIALRGYVTTDENGYYELNTIYPGEYTGRTRHIHVKVTAPGKDTLTTQLILSLNGDDISFDEDTVSQGLPNCHLLSLNGNTPPTEATFDFRLAE